MTRRMGSHSFRFYIASFSGLSREIWLLSFSTLINRAGTVVIPFLSIYMADDLGFSLSQIGWVMTCFGFGSLVGSWLGGKLSDKISYYRVMVISMLLSGFGFMALVYFKSFIGVCFAIFIQMVISDSFRPAAFTAIDAYSKPENKTRSIALIRLFINLGYSVGPALGGIIYYSLGATLLFYLDGITCILSSVFILIALKPKRILSSEESLELLSERSRSQSVWKDKPYLLLLFILILFSIAFFQLFANLPLFYKEVHMLNEKVIGWIMAINGLLICITEMPLIHFFETKKRNPIKIIMVASLFLAVSYLLLNLTMWFWILIISMILLTISEMLAFPFSNSWSLARAPKGRVGEYMGAYTIAFSISHIIGPNLGMQVSALYGYDMSWYLMAVLGLIAAGLSLWLHQLIKSKQ